MKRQIVVLLFSLVLALTLFPGFENKQTAYIEEGRKKVNGAELYYKIMGSGEPIVILHGGPGLEHTYLLPQMGKLAHKYQLIFYDQRTSGGSVANIDSSSVTLETFVEDLEGIRKAFDLDKMNLMGHSWGGTLAMFYAIQYPDNINALMLISSAGARSDFWDELYDNIDRNRTSKDSLALASLRATEDFKNRNKASVENYLKIFFRAYFYDQTHGDSLTIKLTETTVKNLSLIASRPLGKTIRNYDIVDQLSAIKSPTLAIHGENDVIPAKYAEEIHENIEDSDLFLLKKCGHFPYIETPDEFFGLISEFMEGIPEYTN